MTLRRSAALFAQAAAVGVVVWIVANDLRKEWSSVQQTAAGLSPNWWLIAAGGLVVFASYFLLIQTWRMLMRNWDCNVSLASATRIWFVAVLGRYLPLRFMSAVAVGFMARQEGASAVAAVGSALFLTLINTIVGGCMVVALLGPTLLEETWRLPQWGSALLVGLPLIVILVLPALIPPLVRLVRRVTRRDFQPPAFSWTVILRASLASATAWFLYGVAFWIFSAGLLGVQSASLINYVAVYVTSYLVGYIAILIPGGVGVREWGMARLMPVMVGVSVPAALVTAWYSRAWLTVLEILPGMLLLLHRPLVVSRPSDKFAPPNSIHDRE